MEQWSGLRVIGNVQGYADESRDLIEEARRLDLGVLQLGDIMDRGPDSPCAVALRLDPAAQRACSAGPPADTAQVG